MSVEVAWRGSFRSDEVNQLHAAAFGTRLYGDDEWNWCHLVETYSLGWVVARDELGLVGFANVVWDGLVHAWIQDVMVDERAGRRGIGRAVVAACTTGARSAGCETLHVDFEDDLAPFYIDACGFTPARAGLVDLTADP